MLRGGGSGDKVVHCCPLSLWYLDAETGYKVATPYTRLLEINEALGAKIDRSGSFFFAKCISYMYDEAVKFSWPCHLYQSRRQEAQEDGHGQNVRIEVKMSEGRHHQLDDHRRNSNINRKIIHSLFLT